MPQNQLSRNAMIQIRGDGLGKCGKRPSASTAVASHTRCHQILGPVASALAVRLAVVKSELRTILNRIATPATRHAVSQIYRKAFLIPYPLHALAAIRFSVANHVVRG